MALATWMTNTTAAGTYRQLVVMLETQAAAAHVKLQAKRINVR